MALGAAVVSEATLSNDARRHQLTEVLALAQEQMADIAAVQRKQAAITATGVVADGLVQVTVNAAGHVVDTVIDDAYLDDYEFDQLAEHITTAAQQAVRSATSQMAELMAPLTERRSRFPSLSELVDGAPDLRELMHHALRPFDTGPPPVPDGRGDADDAAFPTVRR